MRTENLVIQAQNQISGFIGIHFLGLAVLISLISPPL